MVDEGEQLEEIIGFEIIMLKEGIRDYTLCHIYHQLDFFIFLTFLYLI